MDFYGDGVRGLLFQPAAFPREHIAALQALLAGEHAPFAIRCEVGEFGPSVAPESEPRRELLAIFSRKILVTKGLADALSSAGTPRST